MTPEEKAKIPQSRIDIRRAEDYDGLIFEFTYQGALVRMLVPTSVARSIRQKMDVFMVLINF